MRFANPAGLGLLALAIPVILTHILRPRRMPVTVSSTMLWRKLERPVAAAKPWQKLRWSLLLLAQLLAVTGLALAVAKPERVEASPLSQHTVFIIDASASMAATDGSPDRLADAVDRAVELRGELPGDGMASIVIAGNTPRVTLTASTDSAEFERSLRTIDQSAGHPDFADAFALAESLDTGSTPIGYVFLTDGGLADTEERLLPPGTRVEQIGSDDTNRAITRLIVDSRTTGLHARVSVSNTGGAAVTQSVRVDVDGVTAGTQEVSLGRGESADVEFDLPEGDLVEAFLEGGDLLSADDHAFAVAKQASNVRVLLAGDPLFWEQLLSSIPGVSVETTEDSKAADGFDLAIYSGVEVPDDPGAPFIAIAPPGGLRLPTGDDDPAAATGGEITVDGDVERPAVTLVRTDDPLLHGIDLSEVAIASAQRVEVGGAEVLVAGEGAPLLVRGQFAGERYAYFTFDLRDSNLGVQLAFPLLAERLVGQLSGTESAGLALTVGDRLPVPLLGDATVTVTGADARPIEIEPGDPAPRALRPGFVSISVPDRPEIVVAVNPPRDESELAPRGLTAPEASQRSEADATERSMSLLPWVLYPLLAIVLIELVLAWRNVGVGRRQWYLAVGLRTIVAALLVAALFDPVLRRPAERVATVFVIDGSASVGAAGTNAAEQFVADALAERPDSALAGVVVFGADARVDQVMGDASSFGGPTAVIDRGATDIAGGLRLGAAMLPNDARRRIVLVSDGRATSGDVSDELEELEAAGIPVDVVTLETTGGPDAAVAGIDLPDLARPDDVVPVIVHVQASEATEATVLLRRDGEEVGQQTVQLEPGNNEVRFEDTPGADAGAVMRYQATVTAPRNTVAENDVGYGAVAVEGPARVLVVEGSPGEAETLVAALDAGGVGTEVIGVGNIPDVQELITYAGIVMVDVDARTLTGDQVDHITTAVRDLGRGLVTIGGERSYGVGGYLESPLNDLLPVDSEIVDPMRRRTVAEVLSIDTSESMGACHCAGEAMGNAPAEGGINKTDISRAAAERTIAALSENDQVGVLAWNSSAEWVIELQTLPPADVIDRGLRSLQPSGNTDIRDSLADAAEALIASDAELKHIILFTDGFTAPGAIEDTAEEAGRLFEEHGITVSVLATGESPEQAALEDIATAGHGRFYAGTDFANVPEIMAEEAVIASRNFITEGEFFPEVTSDDEVVSGLTSSPPLLGYVATTAKGQATTLLRIGPDRDPLLATWQAGLGRVSSWTSDANDWAQQWSSWDGFVDFFSGVVKDTLPAGDNAGAVQADVRDGQIRVTIDSAEAFPDGAAATATVAGPDGQSIEVALERTDDGHFEGAAEAPRSGTYAVSGIVTDNDGETVLSSSTLASNSYPAEYVPGAPDVAFMTRLATSTDGRTDVTTDNVWDSAGLRAGSRVVELLPILLLVACLLWPIAVVLSRISVRGATAAGAREGMSNVGRRVRDLFPKIGGQDPEIGAVRRPAPTPIAERAAPEVAADRGPAATARPTGPATPAKPAQPAKPAATAVIDKPAPSPGASSLNDLLAKKRERRTPKSD
jgi:Mg-chelatase subunit ChlD